MPEFKVFLVFLFVGSISAIDLFHKRPKVLNYSYKTVWYDQKVRHYFAFTT